MRRRMGRPGLVGTMARTAVVAGTATAVVGHSQNKQAAKQQAAADAQMQDQQMAEMQAQMDAMQAQQAEQAQQAAPPPPPAPAPAAAPAAGGDLMAELSKLADLKAAGVLTDEEFAAAKAKLLA
jgi:Short C-terminal domain